MPTDKTTGEITEDEAVSLVQQQFGGLDFANVKKGDSWETQVRIASQVIGKTSIDDMFAAQESTSSDTLEGRTFTIVAVDWDIYTAKDTGRELPLAKVTAEEKGEKVEWITTAPGLTLFLKNAEEQGLLPFTAKINGVKTDRGYTTLKFGRP